MSRAATKRAPRARKPSARVQMEEHRLRLALHEQASHVEQLNLIDRALGANLKRLAEDMEARLAAQGEDRFGAGAWRGARDFSTSGRWNPPSSGADEEMATELPKLRRRSADLVRNNVWAATLVGSLVDQVVGTGFDLQSTARADMLDADEAFVEGWRQACEDVWARYVEEADVCEVCSAHDMARLALIGAVVRGDVFLIRRAASPSAPEREFRVRWQLVEADQVRTPIDEVDANDLRFGVKLGRFGRPIGYFVHDAFENDFHFVSKDKQTAYRFVRRIDPATGLPNVIHLMRPLRPGQTRGLPWLAPVIPTLDDVGQMNDAVVIREKLAASLTGFLKRNRLVPGALRGTDADGVTPLAKVKFRPGAVHVLDAGVDLQVPELKVPTTAYGEFVMTQMKGICAALGFPSIWALKDYAEANYSNLRGAALDARVLVENWQSFVGRGIYRTLWQTAIEEAWLDGRMGRYSREVQLLDGRGRRTQQWGEWMRVRTQGPVRGIIDLDKEVAAYALAVEKGFLTEADVHLLMTGRDWRDQKAQRRRELDEAARMRLSSLATKERIDAYAAAVTARAVTPQPDDEAQMRQDLGLPPLTVPAASVAPEPSQPAVAPPAEPAPEEVIPQ